MLFASQLQRTIRYSCRHYKIVSNAGFNKKRLIEKAKRDEDYKILNSILDGTKIECPGDVHHVRNKVLNSNGDFTVKNVDRTLLNYFAVRKQFNTGLNYIEYLDEEQKSKLNLFLTNQCFKLYYHKRHAEKGLSEKEEEHLLTLYGKLRESFPVLDAGSLENAILGLSVTKEWRKCLELLDEIRQVDKPVGNCYSAIAAAAFLNNEEGIAWTILQEMFEKERSRGDVIFSAYIETLEKLKNKKEIITKLETLFEECAKKDIIFSENIILELSQMLDKNRIHNTLSFVNKRGCSCCGKSLYNFELPNEVFEKLKEKIVSNVIVGKNIFSKTTPEEFLRFQDFLKGTNDCSVVIDGLNVAYSAGTQQSTQVYSSLLANVVAYFANKGKNIVVLGRAHMDRWPKNNWSYIKNNSRIFLTQDISQDDPYLLYCALHCGKNTIIVSKDLMRSHLFLLKDPNDKMLFSRWLAQRLYQLSYVTNDGVVHFKFPPPYTRTMQKNNGNWHIPYNSYNSNREKNDNSNTWLCIQNFKYNK